MRISGMGGIRVGVPVIVKCGLRFSRGRVEREAWLLVGGGRARLAARVEVAG